MAEQISKWKASPHARESEKILDSGFLPLDSRFQLLDSHSLSVGLGFRIWIVSGIPDSLSCIPDSKAQHFRFHKQKFLGFRNTNSSLAWGEGERYLLKQVCIFPWPLTFSNKNSTIWVWFLPAARWSGVLPLWSRRVILQMAGSLLTKYSTMGIDPCSHAMWNAVILSDRCHIHTVDKQLVRV